jgi:CheY-like chemotaxis protein
MNITVIQGLLKRTQIEIDFCYSGIDSLEKVRQEHYDIILLDFRMPKMDGIQTLQRMKEVPYNKNDDTPIICLTANAVAGAREKYLAAGFTDYLSKPVQSDKLERMMIKYLPKEKVELVTEASPSRRLADLTASDQGVTSEDATIPSFLLEIPEIDVATGVKNTGSNEDYLTALHIFAESIEDNIAQVQRFYSRDDWDDFTIRVHAIKSSARIIGAAEISGMAKDLESYGEERKVWEIHENTNRFLTAYAQLGQKLAPLLDDDEDFTEASDASDLPVISEEEMADAYSTLRELSASLAYDDAKDLLNMLKEYALPKEEITRLKDISSALEKLDWDRVVSLLPTE